MNRFVPILVACALVVPLATSVLAQQSNPQQGAPIQVTITSTFQGTLRAGAAGEVTITLTNTLPQREVVLRATATFMVGTESRIAHSNELRFAIDDSIAIPELKLTLTNMRNIVVRDGAGQNVSFTMNGGDVILNNIVVGQAQPTVLKVTGNVAVSF